MAKSSPTKKPDSPAAPDGAAKAADAAGTLPSQVGAGEQPGAADKAAPGSAKNPERARPGDGETGKKSGAVKTDKKKAPDGGAPPSGSRRTAKRDLVRVHPKAADNKIPDDVLRQACEDVDVSDVIGARRYPDRWVLVVMSETRAWKIEVPHAAK